MERVSFMTIEEGDDLILSFAIEVEPSGAESQLKENKLNSEVTRRLNQDVGWVEPVGVSQDKLRDTHHFRMVNKEMHAGALQNKRAHCPTRLSANAMGIGARRLHPCYG
jgi:hypothetical protein